MFRGSHPDTGYGIIDESLTAALADKKTKFKKQNISKGKRMEDLIIKADLVSEIAKKLGMETVDISGDSLIGEITTLTGKLQTAEAKLAASQPDIDRGKKALEKFRADVFSMAVQSAQLKGNELKDTLKTRIKKADWDMLEMLQETYQDSLVVGELGFNCEHCGKPITELKQSETLDPNESEATGKSTQKFGTADSYR